jgi:hypothetical protein
MNDARRIANIYYLMMEEEGIDRIIYSPDTPLKKPDQPAVSEKERLARERTIKRQMEKDQQLDPEERERRRRRKIIKDAEDAAFNKTIKGSKLIQDLKTYGVALNVQRKERGYPPIQWDIVFNQEGRRSDNIPEERRQAFIQSSFKKENVMVVISPAGHKPSNWIIAHRVGHGLLKGHALHTLKRIINVYKNEVQREEERDISYPEFFKMVSYFSSVENDGLTDEDEYYNELMAEYITLGTVRFHDVTDHEMSDFYRTTLNSFFDKLLTKAIGTIVWE